MTAKTPNPNSHSSTIRPDSDRAKDIVFYDGMSEEELDLLLQASLSEDTHKGHAQPTAVSTKSAIAETSEKSPIISTAVSNAQVPRPNKPIRYYSALSPSVADRTVFRSDSQQVTMPKERAALQAAQAPKSASEQLTIEDSVVELADDFKQATSAVPDPKASPVASTPKSVMPAPKKSLKALTAAHSTSLKIRPKVIATPAATDQPADTGKNDAAASQTHSLAAPSPKPATDKVDSDTPKRASAIKIKPKAALTPANTITGDSDSDSEVIVAQPAISAPLVSPIEPPAVARLDESLVAAPAPFNTEPTPAPTQSPSTAEPTTEKTILPEAVPTEAAASAPTPLTTEPSAPNSDTIKDAARESSTSDTSTSDTSTSDTSTNDTSTNDTSTSDISTSATSTNDTSTNDTSDIKTSDIKASATDSQLQRPTDQEGPRVETPDTQQLSEQVSADLQSFKAQLHQLTLQFHELGNLSSRLMQQLRYLQSNSTEDFSVTYEQMLELRSHLVTTKKQASDLPSLLDVAEEALESDMFVAQTRKKRQ